MSKSSIEWTQATWNPIVGCSIVSPGCTNCYAMKMAARLEAINTEARASGRKASVPHYDGITRNVNGNNVWTGMLAQSSEKTLLEPLRNKRPTVYFVNSMSDLFHEVVPDDWIDTIFAVMALTPRHTYQVLTKRAKRMREYLTLARSRMGSETLGTYEQIYNAMGELGERGLTEPHPYRVAFPNGMPWPLPNVWLGVSTERQKEANERIPELLATPVAVRFISAEPLLGPIDLTKIQFCKNEWIDVIDRRWPERFEPNEAPLDWVIVGGESGPGSRPMHPDWARSLRDQCLAASVPFFFKQWGNWYPIIDRDKDSWDKAPLRADREPDKYRICNFAGGQGFHGERVHLMQRYGKKQAGRELDGILHDEMPAAFTGRRALVDELEGTAP